MISGRIQSYICASSGRPGCPDTCTCACRSVTMITPRSDKRIHDPPDRRFVSGDDLRREDHRVALGQLDVVIAERDAAECRALLALPARRHDQHFLARQAHGVVETDRLGEVLEVAGRLRDARRSGRASGRPCTTRRPVSFATRPIVCSRAALEAKVVTTTRPRASRDFLEQPLMDPEFRPGRRVLEDVGRIADEGEHALVADLLERLVARRLAEHRRLVDLPVAGMEDAAVRRLDQQPVAFRDRVRERDIGELERADVEARIAGDDVELHLAR